VVGPSFSFSDCFEFNLNGSSHAWQWILTFLSIFV
jgi:hypothetical protein